MFSIRIFKSSFALT